MIEINIRLILQKEYIKDDIYMAQNLYLIINFEKSLKMNKHNTHCYRNSY